MLACAVEWESNVGSSIFSGRISSRFELTPYETSHECSEKHVTYTIEKPHGNSLHRGTVKNVDDLDFRLLRTQHARENAEHDSCTAGANASVCRAPWHVAHYR